MAKRVLYSLAPLHYSAIRQLASDWQIGGTEDTLRDVQMYTFCPIVVVPMRLC